MKLLSTIDFPVITLAAPEACPPEPGARARRRVRLMRDLLLTGGRDDDRWTWDKEDRGVTTLWFNGNQAFILDGHLTDDEVVTIISIFEQGRLVGVSDGKSEEQRRLRGVLGL